MPVLPPLGWPALDCRPYRCPICEGQGCVPAGYALDTAGATNVGSEPCQRCTGTGVVWLA